MRKLWSNEAYNFTTWLVENLDFLGETLNLELSLVEQEASAGVFSADILAEDQNGNPVIIENQLESTVHTISENSRTLKFDGYGFEEGG